MAESKGQNQSTLGCGEAEGEEDLPTLQAPEDGSPQASKNKNNCKKGCAGR